MASGPWTGSLPGKIASRTPQIIREFEDSRSLGSGEGNFPGSRIPMRIVGVVLGPDRRLV